MEEQIKATITSAEGHVRDAYNKLEEMGATMPAQKNIQNLRRTIFTLPLDLPKYTVRFEYPDGTSTTQEVLEGDVAVEPAKPTKEGCVFKGWYKSTAPQGDGTLWGTIYTTSIPEGIVLNSRADYDALGTVDSQNISINGVNKNKSVVLGFSFGSACTYAPDYFLFSCHKLTTVEHVEVLRNIGSNFLAQCPMFNVALGLLNVVSVGDYFLYHCENFNSPVDLPKINTIGNHFMRECIAFAQPLVIASAVASIGNFLLCNCHNFTGPLTVNTTTHPTGIEALSTSSDLVPMYTTGVTITGTGALAWKGALPDRTYSPYRKLIYQAPQITFAELKAMLNAGETVPIGAEIPDTWNGESNPLIVAQQLDGTNNSAYGGAEGVILVRKYIEITDQIWSDPATPKYNQSNIYGYLANDYGKGCSSLLTSLVSSIAIPCYGGNTTAKYFLMSPTELFGVGRTIEGFAWDLWKQRTGLMSASNDSNDGRAINRINQANATTWYTRSSYTDTTTYLVSRNGRIYQSSYQTVPDGILVACFIAKD